MNKKSVKTTIRVLSATVLVVLLVLTGIQVGDIAVDGTDNRAFLELNRGNEKTVLLGHTTAHAAGSLDYVYDGADDDVQWQAALDALPATGGRLVNVSSVQLNFSATVTRAIANVTIEGPGAGSYFTNDGVTPLFTAGGNSWHFTNLRTDAGSINMGATTGGLWTNVTVDTQLYTYYAPTAGIGNVFDLTVANSITAPDVTMDTDADVSGNTWVLDEDAMGSDSNTKVATQQSVKAYVDAQVATDITGDIVYYDPDTTAWVALDCDGTEDEVQLDAANDAADGGYVYLHKKKYIVSATGLTLDNCTMVGGGQSDDSAAPTVGTCLDLAGAITLEPGGRLWDCTVFTDTLAGGGNECVIANLADEGWEERDILRNVEINAEGNTTANSVGLLIQVLSTTVESGLTGCSFSGVKIIRHDIGFKLYVSEDAAFAAYANANFFDISVINSGTTNYLVKLDATQDQEGDIVGNYFRLMTENDIAGYGFQVDDANDTGNFQNNTIDVYYLEDDGGDISASDGVWNTWRIMTGIQLYDNSSIFGQNDTVYINGAGLFLHGHYGANNHWPSSMVRMGKAGEALSRGQVVFLKDDGEWYKCDADAAATMPDPGAKPCLVGSSSIAENAYGILIVEGDFYYDTFATKGAGLFVSCTAGAITETAPSGAADVVMIVGNVLDDITTAHFDPCAMTVTIAE